MKRLFILTFATVFLLATNLLAEECVTIVPGGTISGETWTLAGSPYCVEGDLIINNLTIEPGVKVQFAGDYAFEVAGVLTATGTEENNIVFTGGENHDVNWQGVFFNYSLSSCELIYCTIENSINSGIRVDNCSPTIRNCTITGNVAAYGGGMNIYLSSLIPLELIIEDCLIELNESTIHGGGIRADIQTGSLKLVGCKIKNNSANPTQQTGNYVGGGMYATVNGEGNLLLSECEIIENISDSHCYDWNCNVTGRAGGIYFDGTATNPVSIENCIIKYNIAYTQEHATGGSEHSYSYGGGIYIHSGDLEITNSVVWSNNATAHGSNSYAYGGAIYLNTGALTLTNCTVTENYINASGYDHTCHADGGGLTNNVGMLTVTNSIVFYNAKNLNGTISYSQISGTTTVTYSDVQDGYTGDGNINMNPVLDGYHIDCGISPCLDAGTNDAPDIPATDIDGEPRICNDTVDMGADECCDDPPPPFSMNIKVNGRDNLLNVTTNDNISVTVELEDGEFGGTDVDLWIGAVSTLGTFWVNPSGQWIKSGSPIFYESGPLHDMAETTLLDMQLPVGVYTFFFILDNAPDEHFDIYVHEHVNVFCR